MPFVLFNIGWMEHYRGQTESDRIFNGGRYVQKNATGGEVRNFEPVNGRCYGYVRTKGGGQVNLVRLGADPDAEYADNVTVVFTATFTATLPERVRERVVVGWYRNARVWRERQRRDDYDIPFVAEAPQEDCVLLERDDRVFPVSRTGSFIMGRNYVRYTDKPEAEPFLHQLSQYMENPPAADVPAPPSALRKRRGTPRQSDPALRAKVEKAAIEHVIDHWPDPGYECKSVELENKGWDLEFTRGARKLLVEVKGCSGDPGQVELTPNEYKAMWDYRDVYRLAIVTRALEVPRLSIIRFNRSDETWRDRDAREIRLVERTGVIVRVDALKG